jgi:hypothetical protein
MKTKFLLFIFLFLFTFTCRDGGTYKFSLFSYPPNSTPHESDWEYLGEVYLWEQNKNYGVTHVTIAVENKNDEYLLIDKFELSLPSNMIDACEKWDVFDSLTIYFSKCDDFCCDDSGAVHFQERLYIYNESENKFILRQKTEI